MEAVIFVGVQASGKSSFYRERFFNTHVRVSLDMLRTRHRERLLIGACLGAKQKFVVDNTNPTVEERARYINLIKPAGFNIVCYYFQTTVEAALARNGSRAGREFVPIKGIWGTHKRLQAPSPSEGFDALHRVRIDGAGGFTVDQQAGQGGDGAVEAR